MKRLLGIISALGLVATTSSTVVACGQDMQTWATPMKTNNAKPVVTQVFWDWSKRALTVQTDQQVNKVTADDLSIIRVSDNKEIKTFSVESISRSAENTVFVLNDNWDDDNTWGWADQGKNYIAVVNGLININNQWTWWHP